MAEDLLYKVKCWLYPKLNRFAEHGGRFYEALANGYKEYDKIYAVPPSKKYAPVSFIDKSQIVGLTFLEVCEWIAEYNTTLEAALKETNREVEMWREEKCSMDYTIQHTEAELTEARVQIVAKDQLLKEDEYIAEANLALHEKLNAAEARLSAYEKLCAQAREDFIEVVQSIGEEPPCWKGLLEAASRTAKEAQSNG